MEHKKPISGVNAPVVGIYYFITRPYLWIKPLLGSLLTFLFLFFLFTFVAYFSWPKPSSEWYPYTLNALKSIGYASLVVLIVWATAFTVILNSFFSKLLRRVLQEKGAHLAPEKFSSSSTAGLYILQKTILWRLFWILLSLVTLIFITPVGIVIAQIGMGHIAMIDGCDLALSLQGHTGHERVKAIQFHRSGLLYAGLVSGGLSILLGMTFLGWIFWLPGVFVGSALWTMHWSQKYS